MTDDLLVKFIEAGIRFVSIHPRSEKEIRAYLAKKLKRYHTDDVALIERTFERLDELGYVDDRAYARAFVASRNAHNPKGDKLLTLEMKAKGVAPEIIANVLDEAHGDSNQTEADLARKLIEKRKAMNNLPDSERKRKLFSYLSRRGFSSDAIRRVIDEKGEND